MDLGTLPRFSNDTHVPGLKEIVFPISVPRNRSGGLTGFSHKNCVPGPKKLFPNSCTIKWIRVGNLDSVMRTMFLDSKIVSQYLYNYMDL